MNVKSPVSPKARLSHCAVVLLATIGACFASSSSAVAAPASLGNWMHTGSLLLGGRDFGASAVLPDGEVLYAGGKEEANDSVPTVEAYDPGTGVWTVLPQLLEPRVFAVAARLPDGSILVAGGRDESTYLTSAEEFDPSSDTWTSLTANMLETREGAIAVSLPNGNVLVAGGENENEEYLETAEIYDPATEAWTSSTPMLEPRERAVAVALPDGDVLVAGGENEDNELATAEIYDPSTSKWTAVAPMHEVREGAAASLLPNGDVLVVGGENEAVGIVATAEMYDPADNTWTPAEEMFEAREGSSAETLPNGEVLVVGGWEGVALSSAELYSSPADPLVSGAGFGEEIVGETSQTLSVTVTNLGVETLSPGAATLSEGPFAIASNGCSGRSLALAQTCTMSFQFTPPSAREYSAKVTLASQGLGPEVSFTLTGTGVAPTAGTGKEGAPGTPGPAGPEGKEGKAGAQGPRGAAEKVELLTCRRTRRGGKTKQVCTIKQDTTPTRFTTEGSKLATTLKKGKKVEATGFIVGSADERRLVVTSKRALTKGAYEISFKRGGKPHTEALTLR
jgi:Kelch motif/Galactose oxidase, central domain